MPTQLSKLDQGTRLLAEANSLPEIKDIRDKAEAIRLYARQRGTSLDAQNMAAELKIKAEHKLGTLLKGMEKNKGQLKKGKHLPQSHDASAGSLKDLGIKKDMSSRWQRLAEASPEKLERTLKALREAEQDLTTAAVLRALQPEPLPPLDDADRWESVLLQGLSRACRMSGDLVRFLRKARYFLDQFEKGTMS